MRRLARYDVGSRWRSERASVFARVVFGVLLSLAMIGLRMLIDFWAPVSGPFALIYPTILLATLYGRWQAGVVALAICFLWAWYVLLPYPQSFEFAASTDPARVLVNLVAMLVVLIFAEGFRRAVRANEQEAQNEIARRKMLMEELSHRTKNNFAMVASLLEIQKRRQPDPALSSALDDASRRVRTFAEAYSNLAEEQEEGAEVAIKPYLERLLDQVGHASFYDGVKIENSIDELSLPRDQGVAIGLYLNEALANCGKYAFPDGRSGKVHVVFDVIDAEEGRWSLRVQDDGVGSAASGHSSGGLGSSLMVAFAQQAQAEHRSEVNTSGCTVVLTSKG